MSIEKEIVSAINLQINQELSAAYNYLGMSSYFEHENLPGFAQWCFAQYQEELEHAHRLFHYLLSREGGTIDLKSINAPRCNYSSVLEVFEIALQQEKNNTLSINDLYKKATELNDYATITHLQWFIDEQVEEEKTVGEILSQVKLAKSDPHAILYLNDKFSKRPLEDNSN